MEGMLTAQLFFKLAAVSSCHMTCLDIFHNLSFVWAVSS
jgi:hypothetical protein